MAKENNGPTGDDATLQSLLQILINHTIQAPTTNNAYQIMPDLSQSIGDFNGECEIGGEAEAWLNNLNATADLHRWPSELKLQMARRHLTGAAHDWLLSNLSEISTWSGFERLFDKTFKSETSFSQRYANMQARVQAKGESTSIYFHNKVRRCKSVNLPFADMKEQILMGLWSHDLSRSLLATKHMDTDELLADILAYERIEKGRAEIHTNERPLWRLKQNREIDKNVNTRPPNTLVSKQPSLVKTKKSAEVNSAMTTHKIMCWNCRATGHSRRDCPSPRVEQQRCNVCHWFGGHHKRTCTATQPGESAFCTSLGNVKDNTSSVVGKHKILHEKCITINGNCKLMGLIDSGSSVCILKESVCRRFGLTWTPDNSSIMGFGVNAETIAIGKTVLGLNIDEASLENVEVYVVPDTSHSPDLLEGRPWCEAPEISYVKHGDTLTYYNTVSFPFITMQAHEGESEGSALISSESKRIQAQNVTMVVATLDGDNVNIPVRNNTNSDIEIKANELLTRRAMIVNTPQVVSKPTYHPLTYSDIQRPESLDAKQQDELLQLLNEHRSCFATSMTELGCTNLGEMDITVKPGSKPFAAKPYRVSRDEREEIQKHIQTWKNHGIVEESNSPYAAPVLLVRKKTGESRLVVDYRRLNDQTVNQVYPLPNVDDLLEQMAGNKMFTVLDLAHGYLQIPLTDAAKPLTSFITPDMTGQFTRMVFGLKNAPFEFAKVMDRTIGHLKNKVVLNYFDDYFIPAKNWEEMKERLYQVLEAFAAANLTLRPSKCVFAAKHIEFLGFVLSAEGIRPGATKVKAISDFPIPQNEHEVRRFLGLASFFRRFVPKFAEKARPLTELTRKEVKFKWGTEEQQAFELVKQSLICDPVLQLFNASRPTELHTDASSLGLAGMLLQRGDTGKLHLVHCISKKTSDAEQKYHSSKLELMAIVWSLDRMRSWLIGIHVTIITDCQALIYMNGLKSTNPQITRWFDFMQEFDIEVKHRSGKLMSHVDALSRAPSEESSDTLDDIISTRIEVCMTMTEEQYVKGIQHSDAELSEIIKALEQPFPSKSLTDNYKLINGILYKQVQTISGPRTLWMVPKTMRKSLAVKFHDLNGHFSVDRTIARITERYYFPRMRRYIKHHISMCPECAVFKRGRGKQSGMLHPITPGLRPFETVNIDHIGPFPISTRGNAYILVLVDNLTKFVKLYPSKTVQSKVAVNQLKTFALTFGLPKRIITDRGTTFQSECFQQYCESNGIQHHSVSVRHPRANGQVERVNSTLLTVITTGMKDESTWDRNLNEVELILNTAINQTTGVSPFYSVYGYDALIQDGLLDTMTNLTPMYQQPANVQREIRERIAHKQAQWKERHNQHRTVKTLVEGEIVFLRRPPVSTGTSTKLQPKYRGPMVVTAVCAGDTYKLADLNHERGHLYATTERISALKRFSAKSADEDSDEPGEMPSLEGEGDESQGSQHVEGTRPKRSRRPPTYLQNYVT